MIDRLRARRIVIKCDSVVLATNNPEEVKMHIDRGHILKVLSRLDENIQNVREILMVIEGMTRDGRAPQINQLAEDALEILG